MKQVIEHIHNFPVVALTKNQAKKYQQQITDIWNLIPLSQHSIDDILQENNEGKEYYGKWEHSLLVLNESLDEVVAFIVGYERPAESNTEYPKTNIHLKSLSVAKQYQRQGIGKQLVQLWLDSNKKIGYKHLDDILMFTVQTNGADFNKHVQKFYESFGFEKTAEKVYPNKTDFIYYLK